eukprot:GHRR01006494.1.p1 GENE.GHRR01006494.1~~GHRR01006494.1.p1  ORF type:complete len:219 (+),score=78.41 GHRR01006494.1:1230-1886(+)
MLKKETGGVPMQVFIAPNMDKEQPDPMRKPAPGMWHYMLQHCNTGVQPDLSSCFFVGDADGSSGTHSDSDKKFAEAVGIEFKLPEELFGPQEGKAGLDNTAARAGMEQAHAGTHPNAGLIQQFEQAATDAVSTGGENAGFKAGAYRKVARSLATFNEKVSHDNLKAVGKLQGIGKSSLDKIKRYLDTGSISEDTPQTAVDVERQVKLNKATEAALKFM